MVYNIVSRVFCYRQCGTCCCAPCGATPFLINHRPHTAWSPDNPQPAGLLLPPWALGRVHYYELTGRRQCSDDSCWWSFEPVFLFSTNPSLLIAVVLASACLGFTGFEALGQRSVDLPGCHSNSQQHQLSRELANHGGSRQRALLIHPLPSGEQRKQGTWDGGGHLLWWLLSHTSSVLVCVRTDGGCGKGLFLLLHSNC